MKKLIYKNIAAIILLIVLPWYVFEKEITWNKLSFDRGCLFIIVYIGIAYLLYLNIRALIQNRGLERKVAVLFIIPPVLVLLFFILGYFAFSGFTGF